MRAKDQPLAVLLDEGAPISVADPFLYRSYQVIYHSDVLENGADDRVVAAAAILNDAALIAVDLDMKRLVRRFGSPTDNQKFKSLDLIFLSCGEVLAAKRIEQAMSFIENGWDVRCQKGARRLWVEIGLPSARQLPIDQEGAAAAVAPLRPRPRRAKRRPHAG